MQKIAMRIILGAVIGTLAMAVAQGAAGFFMDANKTGGGGYLGVGSPLIFALIEAFFGAFAGTFIGAVSAGFGLPFPKSAVLSFGLSLMASFVLMIKTETGPFFNYSIGYTTVCYLILGTICGTLVARIYQARGSSNYDHLAPTTFAPHVSDSLPNFLKNPFDVIWKIAFWRWFVIVPVFLWTFIIGLSLFFYVIDRHSPARQLNEQREREAEREAAERRNESPAGGYVERRADDHR